MVKAGFAKDEASALGNALKDDRSRGNFARKFANLAPDLGSDNNQGGGGTSSSGSRLRDELQNTKEALKRFKKESLDAIKGPVDQVLGPFSALTAQFKQLRLEAEEFSKAGYDRSLYNFDTAIAAAADRSLKLTGNLQAQQQATRALMDGFQAVAFTTGKFREEIFETAASLQAAGFDTDAYASIVDTATMSFNLSRDEIRGLTAELVDLQRQFALNPRKMMQDYDYFAKNFAYSTTRLNENFAKLQKMSRITGVDFRKLTESFGENMDTFEGSAQMAGRLNQILGKSMFSSIDLLNKTEAERAEVIRKGIQDRFGGRIDQLKKFELKAIATQLKMSPDEARRFLRGEAPKAAKDLKKMEEKNPAAIMSKMSGNLTKEMGKLTEGIKAFQMPYERSMIELTNSFREGIQTGTAFQKGIGEVARQMSAGILGPEKRLGLDTAGNLKNVNAGLRSLGKTLSAEDGAVAQSLKALGDGLKTFRDYLDKGVGLALKTEGGAQNRGDDLARTLTVRAAAVQASEVKVSDKGAQVFGEQVATAVANALNAKLNIQGQYQAPQNNTMLTSGLTLDLNQGSQQVP